MGLSKEGSKKGNGGGKKDDESRKTDGGGDDKKNTKINKSGMKESKRGGAFQKDYGAQIAESEGNAEVGLEEKDDDLGIGLQGGSSGGAIMNAKKAADEGNNSIGVEIISHDSAILASMVLFWSEQLTELGEVPRRA
ncbi:hypothetical protein BDZ45DRAFT_746107 [Acephala macrosclerotiorum]|nr:hypothetical protein BDZ45DRAFT_746107 [Acephala macrosclerotiorum]